MTSTLAAHYERKRLALGSEFQGYYDDTIMTLFAAKQTASSSQRASKLLRENRRELVESVARWTGHRKFDIRELINTLITRCDALDLYATSSQTDNIIGLTALLTAIAGKTLRTFRKNTH
jgi:hypothetical protein